MNVEKFQPLIENAGAELSSITKLFREKAEFLVAEQLEVMKEEGSVLEMSEDEIDLIKAYRRFKERSKPGSVFGWKSPIDSKIVIPNQVSLLVDPREVEVTKV